MCARRDGATCDAEMRRAAVAEIAGAETEHFEIAFLVEVDAGYIQFAADRICADHEELGKIDLGHIAFNLPGFPNFLESLLRGDGQLWKDRDRGCLGWDIPTQGFPKRA